MATITNDIFIYYGSLLLITFICTYLTQFLAIKLSNHGTKARHPPSPPALPIIGHLHHLVLGGSTSFPKKIHRLATRYGPLLHLKLGASTCILVSNAEFAKEILKNQELNFVYRPEFGSADYDIYHGSDFVLAPYGTYWRFLRKLCMTKLLSNSMVNQFVRVREEEIAKLLGYLIKASKEGEFVDVGEALTTLMNNVICRMSMSTSPLEKVGQAEKIKKLMEELAVVGGKLSAGEIFGPLGKFDLLGYGRIIKKALEEFDVLVEEIMNKHELDNSARQGNKDLMDVIMEASDDPTAEVKLTRKDIKAFFLDIFMAGTETSSVAVKWALAELINHPQVFNKLRQEIQSVVGNGRLIKESDVQNLPYLQAVVKEALRLHPPLVLIFRQGKEECNVGGFHLKPKSRILINLYSLMRDPRYWDEPHHFVPERFMAMNKQQELMDMKLGLNFDYLPFGSGRRVCPGSSLALAMIHATVGALVQCFDWKVKGGGGMVDMREASGFAATLAMANPFVCCPVTHFDPFSKN